MRQLLIFILLLNIGPLCAGILPSEGSPSLIAEQIPKLDTLISATEQTLANEKKLREMIAEYKKMEGLFLRNPEDNDVLFKMAKQAQKTLEAIKEQHLAYLFDTEFIDELTVLAKAAAKRGIPKP